MLRVLPCIAARKRLHLKRGISVHANAPAVPRDPNVWPRNADGVRDGCAARMKTRTIALLLVAVPLLSFVPQAASQAQYADCKDVGGGITACGEVSDGVCGAGSGSGQATGSVSWRLLVTTNHGDAEDTFVGPAAALSATAPCWTDTCTTVILYANGVEIVRSMRTCIRL